MTLEKNNLHKSTRQSNIELLRIFAIILIVAHHIAVHSDFSFSNDSIALNKLWIQFIEIGGKMGVNIFILISGYFGVTAIYIKPQKAIKLWLQIFTYSVICSLIGLIFLGENFGIKDFAKNFLPITYSRWWFASTYFVLYLLSPFLNRFLNSLNKKDYFKFLLLLTTIWSVIPTLLAQSWQSNALLWFVFLYSCSGYVRIHMNINKYKSKYFFIFAAVLILLTYCSVVIFDILGLRFSFFANHATYFYAMERLPIFLVSLMLFCGFLTLKINYNFTINIISSATFGVYLIHDNYYIRNFLWGALFKNKNYTDSNFLIPYTLMQIFIVYAISTIIELARIHLIEKRHLTHINHFTDFVGNLVIKFNSFEFFKKIKMFFELDSKSDT